MQIVRHSSRAGSDERHRNVLPAVRRRRSGLHRGAVRLQALRHSASLRQHQREDQYHRYYGWIVALLLTFLKISDKK